MFFTVGLFLSASGNVLAGTTTEDVVEGAGELGKFGMDVLEDFGLEGKTSEESGKARLEDLIKGKTKDYIKDKLTGGSDLSEGMGLILNQIFEGINSKKVGGPCNYAAMNQAWGIAFDAKHTRLLRGAANIWFDVLTSIPGAPALAEKLVEASLEQAAKDLYKKIRSELEKKISEAWAKQKDEAFKLTKQSGPCSISMTVLWNKKKNKYLFIITGKCDCKPVATGKGGNIAMKSFTVLGGGNVSPVIDLKDPKNPKIKIKASRPNSIKVNADCNCAIDDTRLPPPPEETVVEPDPIDEWVSAPRMSGSIKTAKCEACQPLLDSVNGLVDSFNQLADRMDALGKLIMAERYKTPERDANIEEWEKLSKQQDEIEKKHDEAFAAFAKCEEEECKKQGPVSLGELSTLSEQWTDCKECIPIMEEVNKMIGDYNKQVGALNAIASYASSAKLKHGTVDGNKAYREWHKLKPAADALNASIQQKIAELSACKAKNCPGTRWQTWVKARPISGTCTPCISYQDSYNEEVKKYNTVIDKLNELQKKQQEYIEKHGESGAGRAGYEDLLEKEDLHGLLKAEREGREKLDQIKAALDACVEEKCQPTTDGDYISLGQDPDLVSPEEGPATTAGGIDSVIDELTPYGTTGQQPAVTTGTGEIDSVVDELGPPLQKVSTSCVPCKDYADDINALIDRIHELEGRLIKAKADQKKWQREFDYWARAVAAYEFAKPETDEVGRTGYSINWGELGTSYVWDPKYPGDIPGSAKNRISLAKENAIKKRDNAQTELVEAARRVRETEEKIKKAHEDIAAKKKELGECEIKCAKVKIRDAIHIQGNNPYDRRDPIAEDSSQPNVTTGPSSPSSPSGPSTPVATVQVINNIPISRLTLATPDACLANHYHGAANNCNGVFTTDPDSSGCGHGTVSSVVSIPVTSCPDL